MRFWNRESDNEKIDKILSKVEENNMELQMALNTVVREFKETVNELDSRVDDLNSKIDMLSYSYKDMQKVIEEATPVQKKAKRGAHISEFKDFEMYRQPRSYDLKNQIFKVDSDNNHSNNFIPMTFAQLVTLIKMYKAERPLKEIKKHPLFIDFSKNRLQNYIYIYRAGGFNDTILENARKLGYNPEKLLSHEVKQ